MMRSAAPRKPPRLPKSLPKAPGKTGQEDQTRRKVQHYLHHRQRRVTMFPANIFADPAWDILLDLFVADLAGKNISISSACLASGVPPTTALRWLKRLEEKDLIERIPDPFDGRRVYVRLVEKAKKAIAWWVEDALF